MKCNNSKRNSDLLIFLSQLTSHWSTATVTADDRCCEVHSPTLSTMTTDHHLWRWHPWSPPPLLPSEDSPANLWQKSDVQHEAQRCESLEWIAEKAETNLVHDCNNNVDIFILPTWNILLTVFVETHHLCFYTRDAHCTTRSLDPAPECIISGPRNRLKSTRTFSWMTAILWMNLNFINY